MTVAVGDRLKDVVRTPDSVQLFLFSAATWNAHRIHVHCDRAQDEGHPDLVVQGTLQGAWLADHAVGWAGDRTLVRFHFRNRGTAYVGETLTVKGEVIAVDETEGSAVLRLWIEGPRGITAEGGAVVRLASDQ